MTWTTLVPDPNHLFCTRQEVIAAKDANVGELYFTANVSATVNIGQLAGPFVRARWYDPTTGLYTDDSAGILAATGSHLYGAHGTNAAGGTDFVLRLESVAAPTFWPNAPAGWTVVSDYAFNDDVPVSGDTPVAAGWSAVNPTNLLNRVTDATAPLSPSNVMEWFHPAGFTGGKAAGVFYRSGGGAKTHYVGYKMKYSSGFSIGPGMKNWYPYNPTADFFVSVTSAFKMKIEVQAGAGHGGTYNLLNNVSDPTLTLNTWHTIECIQTYPSNSSTNDGSFKLWIDNVLCGNHSGIGWDTSQTYQEFRIYPVWGSFSSDVVANDSWWWVDHIRIMRP